MPEFTLFPGNAPVAINAGDNGAVFSNAGPAAVLYGAGDLAVAASTLPAQAAITLYGTQNFAVSRAGAARADVDYQLIPGSFGGGGGVGSGGADITSGTADPGALPDGRIYVRTSGGVATDLYVAPGTSAAQVFSTTVVPVSLGLNQIAVVVDPNTGAPLDLYIGVA